MRNLVGAMILWLVAGAAMAATCDSTSKVTSDSSVGQWNGWGATVANDRFQRKPGLKAADASRLQLKWAFGFPNVSSAGAQPAIVGDRVYVGSASGIVYSLGLNTGCTYWSFDAGTEVRTAITVATVSDGASAVFFADTAGTVYSLEASSGKLRWKQHVDSHPAVRTVGSPKVYAGRVYMPVSSGEEVYGASPTYPCCKFRGSIVALDAESGMRMWQSFTIPDPAQPTRLNATGTQLYGPSGAAVWSSPTLDIEHRRIYAATGDSYSDPAAATSDSVLAMDLTSGSVQWSHQATPGDAFNSACILPDESNCPLAKGPDSDFASPPILVDLSRGKRLLVLGQKSGMVYALDPDNGGRQAWSTRVGMGGLLGGVMWGSASDGHNMYVAVSDHIAEGKFNPKAGGLVALRLSDGKELWRTVVSGCGGDAGCSPAQTAAVTLIPGIVFSGSRDGHLRAYETRNGQVIWDFDTSHEFETVNGVKAKGGSIDSGGPAIANGMLLTNSGYALFGGASGNVLLAFGVNSSTPHDQRSTPQ
jgi:polyvinyl alcohol dehydrogenase (cytochrome)